jgi:elongation factor G
MNKYLEAGELSEEDIISGHSRAHDRGEIFPMLLRSAFKNKGVQAMLDAVIDTCRRRRIVRRSPGI